MNAETQVLPGIDSAKALCGDSGRLALRASDMGMGEVASLLLKAAHLLMRESERERKSSAKAQKAVIAKAAKK